MAILSVEQLAGPGYIILNILRAFNIIALGTVAASSIVMIIKTFIITKFFFFDACSHVIITLISLFLIVSECSLFRGYFARNWPLLSPSHGFVSLGGAMMAIGSSLLGNMNKPATSQDSIGLPFWRLIVAAGILAIVIGFFNVVASYVFCDRSRHITARRVRSHGAISLTEPSNIEEEYSKALSIDTHRTGSAISRSGSPYLCAGTPPIDMGSPAEPEKATLAGNTHLHAAWSPAQPFRNARNSLLPSYHSSTPLKGIFHHRRASSAYSRSTSGEPRKLWGKRGKRPESEIPDVPAPMQISAPLNVNPNFAHLVRPNLAHHPSQRREDAEVETKDFEFK